jgi:hypothetical protein
MAKIHPLGLKNKADAQQEEAKPLGRIATMIKAKADAEKAAAQAGEQTSETKEITPTSEANAIIFRIEDIKPIRNENELVDKCGFMVTVFNRMEKEVKEANLDLIWKDSISAKYKIQDDDVKAVSKQEEALTIITKAITLEKIPPHQQ